MELEKRILYIDMDNVIVDFDSGIKRLSPELIVQYKGRYDEAPGIFGLMTPMDGAIESIKKLAFYFDIYILSRDGVTLLDGLINYYGFKNIFQLLGTKD